jgi:CHAT domain-containing protein/tetratricopeptide (TPR) repeat protein
MNKFLKIVLLLLIPVGLLAQSNTQYNELVRLHNEENYKAIVKAEAQTLAWIKDRTDTVAANAFFYLADANLKTGKFSSAITHFEKELAVRQKLLPAMPEDFGMALSNLAYTYLQANDYENGKRVGQSLIDFDKKTFGITSEQFIVSLGVYTEILAAAGEVEEAEKKLEQVMRELPELSKESGIVLSKLADVCSYGGKYRKAERIFYDALERLRISDGEDSEIYNVTLSNYASLLMNQGKYDQAEGLLDQVLVASANKDWFTANNHYATLNNLALVKQSLGLYAASEADYNKLMAVDSATIGVNHPDFSITLSNLGLLYIDQVRLADAERVLKKSIDILKANKETNSISYAKKLNNLAKVYQRSGKFNDAIGLLQQAIKIFEKNFGKQSPEYATATFNLGTVYLYQKSPKALPTLKAALDIRGKVLGKSHPQYAECEERIAQYHWMKKNKTEAGQSYRNVFDNYYGQIDSYFPVLTEEEKSNFFYQKIKPSIESFATFSIAQSNDAPLLGQLFDYQVNAKGLILLATEKVRQSVMSSGDSSLIALYEKWESAKDVLTYYYSVHESQAHIDSLIRVSNELEKQLARQSASFARNMDRSRVSWKAIQQTLKPGEAALECLRYRIFDSDSLQFTTKVGYAFLLLTPETKDGPVLIHLSNGQELESRFLNYYRNGIRLKMDDMFTFKNFWEPIHDQLLKSNIKKVFFAPDGVYNTININSIRNPFTNKYLLEELDVRSVTSTRTLVEQPKAVRNKSVGYLLGFPAYKISEDHHQLPSTNLLYSSGSRSFRGGMLRFLREGQGITPLPGTKVEIDQIATSLQKHFSTVTIKLESEAVESEIKKLSNPSLLHIATHGYFLDEEVGGLVKMPNPLLMSGLILAGAENFIQTGRNPLHVHDDGILTAYEAMNLDLEETGLVVLSACETGLGKVQAGEGVYGLQRAFQVAGAQAIIMSLWNVDDTATQMLMNLFYEEYLNTNDIYSAFRNAQLALMKKYPQPFYWGAFVLVGKGN